MYIDSLLRVIQGTGKDPYFKSNRGDSESEILEQTPDTDDSGPHSCPGEWTKHSNTNSSNRNITQHKAKKIHKVTNAQMRESPTSSSNSQKVSCRFSHKYSRQMNQNYARWNKFIRSVPSQNFSTT